MAITPTRHDSEPTTLIESSRAVDEAATLDDGPAGVGDLVPPRRRVVVAWTGDAAPVAVHRPARRCRRWWQAALVLAGSVIAGVVLTGVQIERDLERRALDALQRAGAVGVEVTFSGQSGEVSCGVPQADPVSLAGVVRAVRGVREVRLAEDCSVGPSGGQRAIAPPTAASAPSAPAAANAPNATTEPADIGPASGEQEVAESGTGGTLPAVVVLSVTAVLDDGRMQLTGTVPTDAQRDALVTAAVAHLGEDAVIDEIVVLADAAVGVDDPAGSLAAAARLVDVAAANLLEGTVALERGRLTVTGVSADADGLAAVQAEADAIGAGLQISPLPTGPAPADTVAQLLGRIVADDPIVFRADSLELDASSSAVLDRIAAVLNRYDGVAVLVVGHTDSGGDPAANQVLSERRALVVAAALMERGVGVPVDADGLGASDPVLIDGVEDPVASRRVEFVVTPA